MYLNKNIGVIHEFGLSLKKNEKKNMYTNGGYIIYRHWLKCSDIQSSVAVPAPVHCNASETRSPEVFIKWSSIRYDVLEDYNETNRTEKAKRANDSTSDENGSQNWMPWIRSENYFERRKKKRHWNCRQPGQMSALSLQFRTIVSSIM